MCFFVSSNRICFDPQSMTIPEKKQFVEFIVFCSNIIEKKTKENDLEQQEKKTLINSTKEKTGHNNDDVEKLIESANRL